ncbi:MAG: nuclear transport factor 2 (NTF2) superfamily protein [Flavobacteriales bacterium]|jgi:nuclear transport factor 2 (NTF2) superfamily protein
MSLDVSLNMNFDLNIEDLRLPLPDFSREAAVKKVRLAEDAWNNKNPEKIATAYSLDSVWRNRDNFVCGRKEIVELLRNKWEKEIDYRLIKELWAHDKNRIAVRYVYEWQDVDGNWFRSHGNENWEFNDKGLMTERHASINDVGISEDDRKFHWPLGRRPDDHPGLSDLGL